MLSSNKSPASSGLCIRQIDPFARNSGTSPVEILEKTFGIATILLLVVVPTTVSMLPGTRRLVLGGAFVVAMYYLFYVLYYLGCTGLPILLGMAAFPPVCFLLVALYQGNYPAIITSLVFGAIHFGLMTPISPRCQGNPDVGRRSRDRCQRPQ